MTTSKKHHIDVSFGRGSQPIEEQLALQGYRWLDDCPDRPRIEIIIHAFKTLLKASLLKDDECTRISNTITEMIEEAIEPIDLPF